MLLAALDQRPPTRDVDLLATAAGNDIDSIARLVREIAMIDVDDGVVFDTARMTTQQIPEHGMYARVRVAVSRRHVGSCSRSCAVLHRGDAAAAAGP